MHPHSRAVYKTLLAGNRHYVELEAKQYVGSGLNIGNGDIFVEDREKFIEWLAVQHGRAAVLELLLEMEE